MALLGVAHSVLALLWYLTQGMPFKSLFRTRVAIARTTSGCLVLRVYGPALGTNWPSLRRRLEASPVGVTGVIVDLSDATIVDQTVLARLTQMQKDWALQHRALEIIGLSP